MAVNMVVFKDIVFPALMLVYRRKGFWSLNYVPTASRAWYEVQACLEGEVIEGDFGKVTEQIIASNAVRFMNQGKNLAFYTDDDLMFGVAEYEYTPIDEALEQLQ